MLHIKGKYSEAKVFAKTVEETATEQIRMLCDMAYTADSKIRIMPDVHAGAGCTIGTTMTVHDKAVPNLVGVDIGCGLEITKLKDKHIEYEKLDKLIREKIPSGRNIRKESHKFAQEIDLSELRCYKKINEGRAVNSIGTLGGGNHFIEIDKNDAGEYYLVIHSGSRYLGLETANLYQKLGYQALKDKKIPQPLAYVENEAFADYIHDMKIIQRYADLNRKAMTDEIIHGMKFHVGESFTTIHNYIDTDAMILRKGAVSAKKGEKLLIPINMRDGSLICTGKGNEDWNFSAPHGAGRLMSRSDAKNSFTVNEFKKQMADIFTTTVSKDTLDECPMAYKNMDEIVQNIEPTAEITEVIKPVYNYKAEE